MQERLWAIPLPWRVNVRQVKADPSQPRSTWRTNHRNDIWPVLLQLQATRLHLPVLRVGQGSKEHTHRGLPEGAKTDKRYNDVLVQRVHSLCNWPLQRVHPQRNLEVRRLLSSAKPGQDHCRRASSIDASFNPQGFKEPSDAKGAGLRSPCRVLLKSRLSQNVECNPVDAE